MPQDEGFQNRLARIDNLVRKLESAGDPALRSVTKELMQSIMDLHAAGLERMMELSSEAGGREDTLIDRFGEDGLVGCLLVLHGLHPEGFETRVRQAVEKVRPMLRSHGAAIELVSIQQEAVHLRMSSGGGGCGSSADSLKIAVEEAIYEAAPDIVHLILDSEPAKVGGISFVPLASLTNGHSVR